MKAEVQALLQKARKSLQAAELLKREYYLDFAASRAYYAMFYAAEALLLDRGLSFSSHSAVIAAFGKEFARTGNLDPRFHRYLIDAQDLRNLGDYGVGPSMAAEQVEEILRWTQELLSVAEGILSARES
jgi:uncharacterized protein (UPF0332 family)